MADILDVFHRHLFPSENLSQAVKNIASEWMENYSTGAKEADFLEILESLKNLNHVDESIALAVEKFLKIKGEEIKDPRLVSVIMKYCTKVRLENSFIQDFGKNYLISQVEKIIYSGWPLK